jgi:hypothetical protein
LRATTISGKLAIYGWVLAEQWQINMVQSLCFNHGVSMMIFKLQFSLIPLKLFDKFIPGNHRGFCGGVWHR